MPLFSIVTVCYNSEKTIERTLQSVLQQTCTDYEYIIIDGKSTDHTLDIINQYRDLFGSKLRVVSEKDQGIYDAMNKGIRMAKGEIVGILNSDDEYENKALELIAEAYAANPDGSPYKVFYGIIKVVDEDGTFEYVECESPKRLNIDMIAHPGCFVTRKTYEDLGMFSLDYRIAADYDFMARIYNTGKVLFIPVFQIVTVFTLGGTSGNARATLEEALMVRKAHGYITEQTYRRNMIVSKIKGLLGRN